jgi:hypothetical protein
MGTAKITRELPRERELWSGVTVGAAGDGAKCEQRDNQSRATLCATDEQLCLVDELPHDVSPFSGMWS